MPEFDAVFPASYAAARERFRAAAARLGAPITTYDAEGLGPKGERLATDTLWLGPADATRVMVLVSATHGVEGYCGAAAQADFLKSEPTASFPPGVAALLIHAINPHGFAWDRRVTQEGVDLNRNGIDFGAVPPNPGFDRYGADFLPKRPGSPEAAASTERLAAFRAEVGPVAYQEARNAGQYTDPKNIFFGGSAPTWSRRTWNG